MFEFCLASKRETNGRRGNGRGQEIGRQFHFGLVSLATDGSTYLKNGIEIKEDRLHTLFDIHPKANSLILKKNG
jgi:hypothetical protein